LIVYLSIKQDFLSRFNLIILGFSHKTMFKALLVHPFVDR
jgi:hypothetical protein